MQRALLLVVVLPPDVRDPQNDPRYMGSFHVCLLTLFRIATLEDWTDVMYTAMEGCDKYGYTKYPEECVAPSTQPKLALAFFGTFVVIANMMVLNLFIGVISGSMREAKASIEQGVLA